jgi:beta-N-acetylhexosaminidase
VFSCFCGENLPFYNRLKNKTQIIQNYSVFSKKYYYLPVSIILPALFLGFLALSCRAQHDPETSPPSLDQKIGQMMMVGFRGLQAGPKSLITHDIKKDHIGGVVLYSYDVPTKHSPRNIKSPKQVRNLTRQLQSYAKTPLFIAIDQEGGKVARLTPKYGFPPTVSAQYLGTLNNADTTRFYARQIARELQKEGINIDLAPVVDLNVNPDNPVIGALHRSFSANPKIVVQNAEIFINEFQQHHIIAALKHFPGHGSSRGDSHKGFVNVTQTWSKKELIPYRKLIASGYDDIIMTAHIFNARLDSVYPATLSKSTITGILRDSLGFQGVVMSDDLQMGAIRKYYSLREAIKRAIKAGADILLFSNNTVYDPKIADKAHRIIKKLVEDGTISKQRINQSYRRIMKLKKRLVQK